PGGPEGERTRQGSRDMKLTLLAVVAASSLAAQTYDVVLSGGRVMDPESGLDGVRNIGIRGRRIAAVSEAALQGGTVVDVKGLVVAPGFIDLHSHGQDDENYRFKARDGVTTALEMEVGVSPVKRWYTEREGTALVNFGATVGHIAAERKAPCYVHMRSPGAVEPGSVTESLEEMIAGAAITGASVHIVHITSMALGQTGLAIEMIEGARRRGLDITTEAYPYTAGQTNLDSAVFDDGWQERLAVTYKDLQWVATGERLTPES